MTRPQPIENKVSPTKASLSAGKKYEMCPAVWPGVSMTRASSAPTFTLSPSPTVSSTCAMRCASSRGATTRHLCLRFEFADAGGVIGVVMGDQNIGEPPAGFFQRRLDRSGFRRVDRRRGAALRVVDQHAEIILQAGEQIGLGRHVSPSFRGAAFPANPDS